MQYFHLSRQSETKYGPPQTKPKVSWKLCLIYTKHLNKDGYGLTVAKIKEFMFSLTENFEY